MMNDDSVYCGRRGPNLNLYMKNIDCSQSIQAEDDEYLRIVLSKYTNHGLSMRDIHSDTRVSAQETETRPRGGGSSAKVIHDELNYADQAGMKSISRTKSSVSYTQGIQTSSDQPRPETSQACMITNSRGSEFRKTKTRAIEPREQDLHSQKLNRALLESQIMLLELENSRINSLLTETSGGKQLYSNTEIHGLATHPYQYDGQSVEMALAELWTFKIC